MAILKGAEISLLLAAGNVRIDPQQEILQAVGISFRMAAGIMGISAGTLAEQRRILHKEFIWLFPIANPHFIRPLLVPRQRTLRAGQFVKQPILSTRKTLGHREGP